MKTKIFGLYVNKVITKFLSLFKPLTVHTEAIMFDDVWKEIKKKVIAKKIHTWYVMTPANYEYYKVFFGIKMSKKKVSDLMKERYKWMLERGERIELHTHLSMLISKMKYKEQKRLIEESIEWFEKNLGFRPKEFVPGWWSSNETTKRILDELGIKLIKEKAYAGTHDFEWI